MKSVNFFLFFFGFKKYQDNNNRNSNKPMSSKYLIELNYKKYISRQYVLSKFLLC